MLPQILSTTLVFLSLTSLTEAVGNLTTGATCNLGSNRLQSGTYQFYSQCNIKNFCSAAGTCQPKGCRHAEYPIGWPQASTKLPPLCPAGQFCPDEEDACLPLLAVGSPCQLNRDDECAAPPNFAQLADNTNHGLNVNGSVCLNYQCMWANATTGQSCAVENTAYTSYGVQAEYIDIVSRDNCINGLYCDTVQKVCMASKVLGATCAADKECTSYNCLASGSCGADALSPRKLPTWLYALVGVGIFGGMFGTLTGTFVLHSRQREAEREKRMQYWREQTAFRQNIMQMRETARNSVLTLGHNSGLQSSRSSVHYHTRGSSDDSHAPILQYAAGKASGLRKALDDDDDDVSSMMNIPQQHANYNPKNPGGF